MIRTRSGSVHAPPRRLAPVVGLILAFATAILVAACSGGNSTSSFGVGPTTGPGESMGLESGPASSGY
jgi:hypothetical protein